MLSKIAVTLIAFLAVAGAMATGSSQPAPVSGSSGPTTTEQLAQSQDILSGKVVSVSPDQIVLKLPNGNNLVLHLSPATKVWNDLWVKSIPVAVGDRIDASVKRRADGTYDVKDMYVNIVNLVGNISSVENAAGKPELRLIYNSQTLPPIQVALETQVTRQGKTFTYGDVPHTFHKGEMLQIIGRQLEDGSVIATKLILVDIVGTTANGRSSQSAPVPHKPGSSPPARQQPPVENFLSGEVAKLSLDQIVLKRQDRAIVVLHLSPKTDVWSGLWVKSIPVQVGDRIYANVKRRGDGSFDVQKMWVNIVNLVGNISSVEKKAPGLQISMENRLLGSVLVNIDPRTQVKRQGKETPYSVNPVELHKGEAIRIIGRRLPNGSVIATKLLLE